MCREVKSKLVIFCSVKPLVCGYSKKELGEDPEEERSRNCFLLGCGVDL